MKATMQTDYHHNNDGALDSQLNLSGDAIMLVSPLVHPPRASKSRWLDQEIDLLLELVRRSYSLNTIKNFFPLRSVGAIYKKIHRCGYRCHMRNDGEAIFKREVKPTTKRTNAMKVVENTVAVESCEKRSDAIIPKEQRLKRRIPFDPNSKAIRMLQQAGLPADPDVICTLTKHIIKSRHPLI